MKLVPDDNIILAAKIIGVALIILTIMWAIDQLFAPISALPYGIVFFGGKRGQGKTFGAVSYLRRLRHFNPDRTVYHNLDKLELPGTGKTVCYINWETGEVNYNLLKQARNAVILIDEAGVFFNAWNSFEKDSRDIARWIAASRHYKNAMILTAHRIEHVAKRIRDVTNECIIMESYTKTKILSGQVYESPEDIGRRDAQRHRVFFPMFASICNSYNTDSLRRMADAAGVDNVGHDADLPLGLGKPAIETNGSTAALAAVSVGAVAANISAEEKMDSIDPSDPDVARETIHKMLLERKARKLKESSTNGTAQTTTNDTSTPIQGPHNGAYGSHGPAFDPAPMVSRWLADHYPNSHEEYDEWEILVSPQVRYSDLEAFDTYRHTEGINFESIELSNIKATNLSAVQRKLATTSDTAIQTTTDILWPKVDGSENDLPVDTNGRVKHLSNGPLSGIRGLFSRETIRKAIMAIPV